MSEFDDDLRKIAAPLGGKARDFTERLIASAGAAPDSPAEAARREAHRLRARLILSHIDPPERAHADNAALERAIDAAILAARVEQAEGMHAANCGCKEACSHTSGGRGRNHHWAMECQDSIVDPRCAAERDRLRALAGRGKEGE